MASGRPCSLANVMTSAGSCTGSVVPGAMGAPTSAAMRRASTFEPSARMVAGCGPIHVMPASMTACANSAFSARKPYPGWTASTCALCAVSTMAAMLRYVLCASDPPSA